eukprot:TRINITY_DN8889_c0_g1_i1.p1 TRINITY_DN8889_c0_g1~~TRINITY_DN8889_c0_g1_i1.p1  ORF type:complete len:171 (-),score=21.82 TRINITY_DN8889_c0_g1_i1:4-516(-)
MMNSRKRGRAFIDSSKAGVLHTPDHSFSGTSRPGVPEEVHNFKFLSSLRSHCVDYVDIQTRIKSHTRRTHAGWADTQGRRASMEDQIVVFGHEKLDLVAVFDGHNGSDTSIWAGHKICSFIEALIDDEFDSIDEALVKVVFFYLFFLLPLFLSFLHGIIYPLFFFYVFII